jgi:uncharacterized protein (DUF1800 family)
MTDFASHPKGVLATLLRMAVFCGFVLSPVAHATLLGPDFDGDGKADLFWHNASTGGSAIWFMNGATLLGGAGLQPSGDWHETQLADFNGDGKTDIVWRNAISGETAMWLMNGGTILSGAGLQTDPNWEVIASGDLNGDGKADLIWRHTNGATAVWLMNGTQVIDSGGLLQDPNWIVTHVADMNGDGKADILWRNQSTGETLIWFMNGKNFIGSQSLITNNSLYITHVCDLSGDGKKDVVWRNVKTGETVIWLLNNGVFSSGGTVQTDPNWVVTHVADFTGDGKCDLLWRNTSTGATAMWIMNGTQFLSGGVIMSDPSWQVSHVADFDGDGKADLVWYNTDTGGTALWVMNGTSIAGGGGLLSDRYWQQTQVGDTRNPLDYVVTRATREAARFLTQTTMGATDAEITRVRGMNLDTWLYQQFITPLTSHVTYLNSVLPARPPVVDDFMEYWWTQAITGTDQFRQRAAFALSQIMVISTNDGNLSTQPYAFARFQDVLGTDAFGNYRQLLKDVTLTPAMGQYLNMMQSVKQNAAGTQFPNENYAREVLQLFSVGLNMLNADGTLQLDGNLQPIPTYTEDNVKGFARAFTGWSWGGIPHDNNSFFNPATSPSTFPQLYYPLAMEAWPQYHETGSKSVLGGVIIAGGDTAERDMDAAIDNIYFHQNVGPFICKQLIQRLITSNPSPAYVGRCVAKFNNDGSGGAVIRGNMQAVWRTIVMDPEARSPGLVRDTQFGKAREPVIRFNTMIRALNGKATSTRFRFTDTSSADSALGESPYRAGSVFNFYAPDYVPQGDFTLRHQTAPELQILTTTSAVGGNNYLNGLIFSGIAGVGGAAGDRVNLDYTALLPFATRPAVLIDKINYLLLNGRMSVELRTTLVSAIEALPVATQANQLDRVRYAVYLATFGPEFAIQK